MISAELAALYRQARAPSFSPYGIRMMYFSKAQSAIQRARWAIQARKQLGVWDDLGGFIIVEHDRHVDSEPGASIDCPGPVRLRLVMDECCDLDDLLGDSFTPEHCPEIPPHVLARERQAEIDRIANDGVWGVIGEYWYQGAWHHADSCFGFISNDWRGSGYDHDIMGATLAAFGATQDQDARDLEAERPDMYPTGDRKVCAGLKG